MEHPNIQDDLGDTPLHSAVFLRPCEEAVRILLEAGANPNAKNRGGATPLHRAALHGDARIIRLLLKYDAVEVLLQYGATPNIADKNGTAQTPTCRTLTGRRCLIMP
jgi:ankyrin repeat protein